MVRIAGTDIDGTIPLLYGLAKIKGIGIRLSHAIISLLDLDPFMRVGYLSDNVVDNIEKVIKNPIESGIPSWMVNRRKDLETGRDMHLIGSDLILATKMDIQLMKRIKSWKGIRHSLGLKVRGQRTRTTGRTGRTVGVSRRRR
ncbi:MAG: 30S ribosomal protein S13 [Candidatus Asgardarchaeia archaeon]